MMLEHLDNLADFQPEAISNIKFDKVVVWENAEGGRKRRGGRRNHARTRVSFLAPGH